jgi:CheY-like chemotaxis protein
MQQVMLNLIVNARDAMPQGGTITIRTGVSGGMGLLSVSDTGVGMTPEILQSIFEPLFTTKRSGTGLGLAVAQQVVERHGGSIRAESTPGVGTLFEILLPLATPAEPSGGGEGRKPAMSSVVLIEDELPIAEGLISLLQDRKIRVAHVQRGAEAIDAISNHQPDAIILDVTLPDMSGFGLYDEIARRWPELPVVFSTGLGDERPPRAGNVTVLRKPYDIEALLGALERVAGPVKTNES